jgi:hypothetical protein
LADVGIVSQRTYIAVGVYPGSRADARLPFPTLEAALQKLRDWVEADEIDDDGPMFCSYGIDIDPPIPSPHHEHDDEEESEDAGEADKGPVTWQALGPFRLPNEGKL